MGRVAPLPSPPPSQSCKVERNSGERVRREEGGKQNQASTLDPEVWELSNMGTAEPRKDLWLELGRRAPPRLTQGYICSLFPPLCFREVCLRDQPRQTVLGKGA